MRRCSRINPHDSPAFGDEGDKEISKEILEKEKSC
jgi:hypothetical protein